MARGTEEKREALKARLVEIAEETIAERGISALRARTIANQAGCAVGAIYNVFGHLDDLVLAVNGRTFLRLGAEADAALEGCESLPPQERLVRLAIAYLHFATENPNAWRSLFDVEMSTETDIPEWYLAALGKLFAHISGPLSEMHPEASPQEIDLLTRALFSAVHGIVLLGLERRISAVPPAQLETMIRMVLLGEFRKQ
ncbi:MAG: TetR/AcrR family transcriptional regulator [Rhodobacteraceae bacterium]|nr:TetR/AcrR family transcriptional regulator [Paracoccaceae bacterium]